MKKLVVLGHELNVKVSPTFLQNAACPLCLKLQYIDRVEDRYIRVSALRGSAAHEAIADLTSIAITDKMPIQELSDDALLSAVSKYTPHEIFAEIGNVLRWVRLWRDRYKINLDHYVGHEEKMAIDDDGEECAWDTAAFRGIVDYIDIRPGGHCIITDYKSQAGVFSQARLDNHDQLTFYCWLASKFYGTRIKQFSARIWYLQYGFYGETTRTMQDINAFEQQLHVQVEKVMEIDNWNPIPGDHCGLCDFIHLCPVGQDNSEVPQQIVSQTQAVRSAQRLRVLESMTSQLKKGLRSYVEANDAIRLGGDFIYGFRSYDKKKWNPQLVEELLRSNGYSVVEIANLDARKLGKFITGLQKSDIALADELEAIVESETRTVFSGYKLGVNDITQQDDVD